MEEFDSEDFSTSEEDEDYVPSGERVCKARGVFAPPRASREVRPAPAGVGPVAAVAWVARGLECPRLENLAPSAPTGPGLWAQRVGAGLLCRQATTAAASWSAGTVPGPRLSLRPPAVLQPFGSWKWFSDFQATFPSRTDASFPALGRGLVN